MVINPPLVVFLVEFFIKRKWLHLRVAVAVVDKMQKTIEGTCVPEDLGEETRHKLEGYSYRNS